MGPCVTNPNIRDWSLAASLYGSLAAQSEGRIDIGLGRGDSSMRVMGKKPAPLARVAEFTRKVKAMVKGEEVTYGECENPVNCHGPMATIFRFGLPRMALKHWRPRAKWAMGSFCKLANPNWSSGLQTKP
ncbi:LLM class flavin-dependent oxidoreductase [Vibrio olivae]